MFNKICYKIQGNNLLNKTGINFLTELQFNYLITGMTVNIIVVKPEILFR